MPAIKLEGEAELIWDRSSSPATLSAGSENGDARDSSCPTTPSSPGGLDTFLEQVRMFAESSGHTSVQSNIGPATLGSIDSMPESDTEYESDRTDFLLSRRSPCPRLDRSARPRVTQNHGQHDRSLVYGSSNLLERFRAIQRPLRPLVRTAHSSIANLQKIEKAPSHSWTEADRELLCVLYRWYNDPEALNITKIFNSIAGVDLRAQVIRVQFHSHLRLYGSEVYSEYSRVYDVPFDDPEEHYSDIRNTIEATAKDLNIDLQKRQVECEFNSGWAKFAKSPRTRRRYKLLVRQARKERKEATRTPPTAVQSPVYTCSLGGMPLFFDDEYDEREVLTDVDEQPSVVVKPNTSRPRLPTTLPHLAFRCWDESNGHSATYNVGFIAKAFVDETGPLPAPMSPLDTYWRYLAVCPSRILLSLFGDGTDEMIL